MVNFIDFNTEWSRDFFSLHEGRTFEYERSMVLVNISGSFISDDFTTISRFLWIRFTSDDGLPGGYIYTGFNVSLSTTPMLGELEITSYLILYPKLYTKVWVLSQFSLFVFTFTIIHLQNIPNLLQ